MEFQIFYDTGDGRGAVLTAALATGILTSDRLPHESEIVQLFEEYYRGFEAGRVYRLHVGDQAVLWCGIGRATPYVVRGWRNFLHLYGMDQSQYVFIECPRLIRRNPRMQSYLGTAKEVRKKFASFQTVILQRWKGNRI